MLKETQKNEQKQQPEEKYRDLKVFKDDTETHRNTFKSTVGTYLMAHILHQCSCTLDMISKIY